jgi:hypothetical protein
VARQSILWTALPNGYTADGKSLRLSVLASPRLDPQGSPKRLTTFPDFVDWPATVAASIFTIEFAGQSVAIAGNELAAGNRVDSSLGTGESATWKALFPGTTFVRPFAFEDLSSNHVVTYDTGEVESLVRSLYSGLARTAGDGLPRVSDLLDDPGWRQLADAVAENDGRFVDRNTGLRSPRRQFDQVVRDRPVGEVGLAEHLARFELFHTPPATPKPVEHTRTDDSRVQATWLEYERAKLPAPSDFSKEIDFHQIVAAMNQYPTLLRRLALVVDFLVDASAAAASPGTLLSVSVELPASASPVQRLKDASPRTWTRLTATRFEALPRPVLEEGDYRASGGLLELDPKQFRLVQADLDGAGLKLMNFARTLVRLRPDEERVDPTTRFEREVGAPSLRNAGLMLVHRDRAAMLKNAFDRSKAQNDLVSAVQANKPGAPPELFAEDLVRGYRVDIWDRTTKVWRSLCQRVAEYSVGGGAADFTVSPEEGTVRLAATKSADPASNQDLVYLHEVLTSWNGWSLCAPQPGKAIDKDDKPAAADAHVPPGIRLRTRFRALANSLPRLRYGRSYWIRARVVDLAGNSLDPQPGDFGAEAPAKHATPYLRFDPIAAPAIALVKPAGGGSVEKPAEGESMHRLAIRSFNVTPADNIVPTGQRARRFAVPARTNVREAEQHGMLDADGKVDASTWALLKQQDKPLKSIALATPGPLAGAASAEKTTYAFFQHNAALPYLPDPLAVVIGARILDLPGWDPNDLIPIPLYPDAAEWPHAVPFTVEILDDPGVAPTFDAAKRRLLVPLPKGTRATLRLSVTPSPEALALMAVWQWLTPAERQKLRPLADRGRHWLLTPWRTLELVHAVQKPLIAPELDVRVQRGFGETSARPSFDATVSLKSTDRVDLQAEWHEPGDDPAKKVGEDRTRSDTAFAVKITDEQSYAMRNLDPRFTGIPEHEILGPDRIRAGGIIHDLVQAKLHEFHDTRYRRIEYWLEGTTRFREYMPPKVLTKTVGGETVPTDEQIKVSGERVRTWIPSSAPPPAPEVLYTVPTFGWVRTENGGKQTSWRRGAGLRVYLDRPWNVSGYGEMLAVVLAPASFRGDPSQEPSDAPYKSFVTQWGNDPIWATGFVRGIAPRRADFPLARTEPDPAGEWLPPFAPPEERDQPPGPFLVTTLRHPALPPFSNEGFVEVAPHDVFYDEDRQLWYCDIEVALGAVYFPFIRLALARYQPVSVGGAHLSNVVLADFMSLAPDRWLNVTQTADERVRRVGVFGATYSDSAGHVEAERSPSMSLRLLDGSVVSLVPAVVSPSSVVDVWVERLEPALGEDFGWVREPGALVRREDGAPARAGRASGRVAREQARARKLLEKRQFEELARADLISRIRLVPALWEGTVTLPSPPSPGTRYRLVIAEYEEHLGDDTMPYDRIPTEKDRRLVFVEHVELG